MYQDTFQNCLTTAYRYLTYRPRSEWEIKNRLRRRGCSSEIIAKVVTKLNEQNLLDDIAFAEFWRDSRMSHKPKSRRLIAKELSEYHVNDDIIKQTIASIDDERSAYLLGCAKIRSLAHLDRVVIERRLINYLKYRGFTFEIIKRITYRLLKEKEEEERKE